VVIRVERVVAVIPRFSPASADAYGRLLPAARWRAWAGQRDLDPATVDRPRPASAWRWSPPQWPARAPRPWRAERGSVRVGLQLTATKPPKWRVWNGSRSVW